MPFTQKDTLLQWLKNATDAQLKQEIETPKALLLDGTQHGNKRIETAYAPFEHVTPNAKIVIVGITPGRQQMANALVEFRRQLGAGMTRDKALVEAKKYASFSGSMRANLIAMLDDIGVAKLLELGTTAELWDTDSGLAHFTSALRYPVFVDGKNYSGAPSMTRVPVLRSQIETFLVSEMQQLPDALYVPLGPKVSEALEWAASRASIRQAQVLSGLPHPSGASGERIAYFLGRKPRELLSNKTNAARIDAARDKLVSKIRELGERA